MTAKGATRRKVQSPKRREVWSFEQLELLQISCQAVVIARDGNGKILGTLPLEPKTAHNVEDMAEWLNGLEDDLADEGTLEKMRAEMVENMNGTPGGQT